MSNIAIRVEKLGKRYRIGRRERYKTLRDTLAEAIAASFRAVRALSGNQPSSQSGPDSDEFIWALKDLSFEVKQGEVIGVIGRNGAGKSTLLKILSRITEPTEGYAEIHGRMGSLLEVGTGFHPELTGRENIYLNGAILGMKKVEIEKKFDEIVAFAEIEKFLDTSVKHYSSGMYMRLAFAVAAHLETEILLVDEVLAVGDAAFQNKCIGKMSEVAKKGRTVLFVSHNLKAVQVFCTRAILLDQGQITAEGESSEVITAYLARQKEDLEASEADIYFPCNDSQSGQITRIKVTNTEGQPTLRHALLDPIQLEIEFVLRRDFSTLTVNVQIWSSDNTLVFATMDSDWDNYVNEHKRDRFPRKAGRYSARLMISAPLLNCGLYELEVVLTPGPARIDTQRGIYFEVVDNGSFLSYVSKATRGGILAVPIKWSVGLVEGELFGKAKA